MHDLHAYIHMPICVVVAVVLIIAFISASVRVILLGHWLLCVILLGCLVRLDGLTGRLSWMA